MNQFNVQPIVFNTVDNPNTLTRSEEAEELCVDIHGEYFIPHVTLRTMPKLDPGELLAIRLIDPEYTE